MVNNRKRWRVKGMAEYPDVRVKAFKFGLGWMELFMI